MLQGIKPKAKKRPHLLGILSFILLSTAGTRAAETIVAGWENWNASTPSLENGLSGQRIAPSGWGTTPGSRDGSFGNLSSPVAAVDGNAYQSSANSNYIEFEIRNSGWKPVALSSIHFDAARKSTNAPDHWKLEVMADSALSIGVIQEGSLDVSSAGDYQDFDIDLDVLSDAELEEASSVVLRFTFSGGSGGSLALDNIGILGTILPGHETDIHYIYSVPANPTASLDIRTGTRIPIDPMHLSLNVGARAYTGFNDAGDQERFRRFDPPSTRWPIGVWANWYDWENDGHRIYDDYDTPFRSAIEGSQGKRYGFPGLTELHDELNFDVLFSWNILYDTPEKGTRRLRDRFEKGFDFKWIELGNELFWKDQRSNITATEELYTGVAKAHAQTLKAEDPYIQLSVPVQFRDADGTGWNAPLVNDQDFFDAISVHKYIRSSDSSTGQADALIAGQTLLNIAKDMAALFPGKPQWYTEWGVSSGEDAVSVIGQTDAFLTFFKHPEYFAMNQFHQVNGLGNRYITDTNKKTSWGAGYDVLRLVFLNSELFESTLTATAVTDDFDVVQAEASYRDGKVTVFAVNKTPSPVPFTFSIDGSEYTGTANHRAFAFNQLTDFPEFEIEEDPLTVVASNTSSILLPPYSLNVIDTLQVDEVIASEIEIEAERAEDQTSFAPFETRLELGGHTYITVPADSPAVNVDSVAEADKGIATYEFEMTDAGTVLLEVLGKYQTADVDAFWFRMDSGPWVEIDGLEGGSWKWVQLESERSLNAGFHTFQIARQASFVKLDRFRLTTVDGTFVAPRVTSIQQIGTTRIEAENYDEGGEGIGYHDRTPGNDGSAYRNENVDIAPTADTGGGYRIQSIQAGEWLQYPITIPSAGPYDLSLRAASEGGSALRILFDNQNKTGTLTIPNTGSLDAWADVVATVELAAGKQMMRLKFTGDNAAVNFIEITPQYIAPPELTADAGADQFVYDEDLDGFALVALDGSASTQGAAPIDSFFWTEGGSEIARGESATATLEFGIHILRLTVSDGTSAQSDDVLISVQPVPSGLGPEKIIAGWDRWTVAGSPTTLENGANGTATQTGWNPEYRAGSSDGTFGTIVGADPTIGSTGDFHYTGLRHPDMTSASVDFTINNTSGDAIVLSTFHFDSICRGTTPAWTLEVLSGAITSGPVASGTVESSHTENTLSDFDVDLKALADNTLDAPGSVTFRLSFASETAKHLELDNVGVSGAKNHSGSGYPDSNANRIPDYWETHYLGDLGHASDEDEDYDGLDNYGEFIAGTHPGNARSTLVAKSITVTSDGANLRWNSVSGHLYKVLKSTDPGSLAWTSISGDLTGTGDELSFTDPAPPKGPTLYKIQVSRP